MNKSRLHSSLVGDIDHDDHDSDRKNVYLKVLVPEAYAGGIIGKSGKSISEIQADSDARVKVSHAHDFYPGTNDRTLVISGGFDNVVSAQELIWHKLYELSEEIEDENDIELPPGHLAIKLSLPAEAAGIIIGRQGANIKELAEQSGARVNLSSKDSAAAFVSHERVLTLQGDVTAISTATQLVLHKLQDEGIQYKSKSTSYGMSSTGSESVPHARSNPLGAEVVSAHCTITLAIPDSAIGHIMGKKGAIIIDIQSESSAKVTVSPRVDAVEGADPKREVVITGTPAAAQFAQILIYQRLQQAADNELSEGPAKRRR